MQQYRNHYHCLWLLRHIALQPERLRSLFNLDDPDPNVGITLEIASKCRVVQCDSAYWASKSMDGRPTDHRLRQTFNANDALKHAQVEWLLHLDADEYLIGSTIIAKELARLGAEIEVVRVQNQERVNLRGATVSDIFDGLARGPISSFLASFVFYRRISKFMHRGMIGAFCGQKFPACRKRQPNGYSSSRETGKNREIQVSRFVAL